MILDGVVPGIRGFAEQAQRVISITYKPKEMEFKQMAFTTALGMLLIGFIGFIITLAVLFIRGR